jgi:hypothetical protein
MTGIRYDPNQLAAAVAKEAVSDANLKTARLPNTRKSQESTLILANKICLAHSF